MLDLVGNGGGDDVCEIKADQLERCENPRVVLTEAHWFSTAAKLAC